jgi:uncharacterized protein Yka (UPF0111/DUF47 family)
MAKKKGGKKKKRGKKKGPPTRLAKGAGKKGLIDRVFPPKYDFHGMLRAQAEITAEGIEAFYNWLEAGAKGPARDLDQKKREADETRWYMESELMKAFSTPFDRTDIYEISRQMDRIIDYASLATREMIVFEIGPDEPIMSMADKLAKATRSLADAIDHLEHKPKKASKMVPKMRKLHWAVEKSYLEALAYLYVGEVTLEKFKRKEVYHNFKVAMKNVGYTVDILHRIVVRLI